MIAACDEAGVLPANPVRVSFFYPMVQAARRMIQSGEIGRVLGIVGGNRGVLHYRLSTRNGSPILFMPGGGTARSFGACNRAMRLYFRIRSQLGLC